MALILSGNALHEADPARYAVAQSAYCEGLQRDLRAYNAYWDAYEGEIAEASDQLNDSYLKFNAQQSGIRSYGEAVDLLLAWKIPVGTSPVVS